MRPFFCTCLCHFTDCAQYDIDHEAQARGNRVKHPEPAARHSLGVGLFILPLGAPADHTVPHLLENRQRCKHREHGQQRTLYHRHSSGRG